MTVLTRYDYFCDFQIRRFELQLIRALSGFQYETGRRGDQGPQLKVVPCTKAKRNRQAAMIMRNASENVVNTVPMITIYMTDFQFDPDRLQNPNHVSHVQVYERKRDPVTGLYTGEKGNAITVERLMPRPFLMTYNIDIWTSNENQKQQLWEQINEMICPTFDIQNSDNPLDWSALTVVRVKSHSYSSLSIPIGTSDEIDVATITVEIPFWLSPPAKIKRQRLIEQIVTNINQADEDADGNLISAERIAQEITTPADHFIEISGGEVRLLGPKASQHDPDGNPYVWADVFNAYKRTLAEGRTQLRVRFSTEDGAPEIIGTLQAGTGPSLLDWQIDVDTLPANTLPPVDAVIDPLTTVPGRHLPAPAEGQRYLLSNDLPQNSFMWGTAGARAGGIVEYRQGVWEVVFSGMPTTQVHYLINNHSSRQLRWNGEEWLLAIDGTYAPGYWRIL